MVDFQDKAFPFDKSMTSQEIRDLGVITRDISDKMMAEADKIEQREDAKTAKKHEVLHNMEDYIADLQGKAQVLADAADPARKPLEAALAPALPLQWGNVWDGDEKQFWNEPHPIEAPEHPYPGDAAEDEPNEDTLCECGIDTSEGECDCCDGPLIYTSLHKALKPYHFGDAGLDLRWYSENPMPITMVPGDKLIFDTGIKVIIPEGSVGMVVSRSGLGAKKGINVINAPGIIDAGYRGEISVAIIHLGKTPYTITPGDRIAQLLIMPVAAVQLVRIPQDEFEGLCLEEAQDEAEARKDAGFGSSGR